MRLARKPVVKRIRTPKKSICEVKKIVEPQVDKISSQKQYDFLKIAINCMFLLNGGAAVALISESVSHYINSILMFSSGALVSVALYLYIGFTSAVENLRKNKFVIKNIIIIYSPLIIFMIGLFYSISDYL